MAKRILIIDDEASVRDEFEFALTRIGYETECAPGGEDGLSRARARRPDLVFLDLRMPGIDGVETLRRLHQLDPGVPVYIVTAFQKDFGAALHQAAKDGVKFQIADKPLRIEQIQAVARGVLEGASSVD
jgi:DNA-binding NtrC family response regulator